MAQPTDTEWPSEPRTLLKHQIYKRYVDCWMGKILQTFPSATIVDAFAGPARYSDGPDGSPLVIAKAYLNHTGRERFRTLRLICNEARADRNEALARRLVTLRPTRGWRYLSSRRHRRSRRPSRSSSDGLTRGVIRCRRSGFSTHSTSRVSRSIWSPGASGALATRSS